MKAPNITVLYTPLKFVRRTFHALTSPRSVDEDARRQEFVLNTLLLGVLVLSFTAFVQVCIGFLVAGPYYNGVPPYMVILVIVFLSVLYALSRRGQARVAAYLFISAFMAIGVGICWAWGIFLPAGPLVFVLVIVMAGILAGTRFSFLITGVVAVVLLVLTYLEAHHITHPNMAWRTENVALSDAFSYIFIWGIITLVSWLSNRELEGSLRRARRSEAALEKERSRLEERVEERTRELKQAQLEKILQLSRFADFGRISSGFLHDIINPLTAVSLNLEQLSTKRRSELLQQAIMGIKHIEDFASAARKQVQGHNDQRVFEPAHEIKEVVAILENKARLAQVEIKCDLDKSVALYGSPIKFHQVVSNLVANAIDAYEFTPVKGRVVKIEVMRRDDMFECKVRDWGIGIPAEHLETIFDPFFTTKPVDKGTGIGLLIAKRIIEEDFFGSLKVNSDSTTGTVFTVRLPAVPQ